MAEANLHIDEKGLVCDITPRDKGGNVVTPSSPPAWTLSADNLVTLTTSADALHAEFVPAGNGVTGDCGVNVLITNADGTQAKGDGTIHVLAGDIVSIDMAFSPLA